MLGSFKTSRTQMGLIRRKALQGYRAHKKTHHPSRTMIRPYERAYRRVLGGGFFLSARYPWKVLPGLFTEGSGARLSRMRL